MHSETVGYIKLIARFDAIQKPVDLKEFRALVKGGRKEQAQWKALTENERDFLRSLMEGRELQFRDQRVWEEE